MSHFSDPPYQYFHVRYPSELYNDTRRRIMDNYVNNFHITGAILILSEKYGKVNTSQIRNRSHHHTACATGELLRDYATNLIDFYRTIDLQGLSMRCIAFGVEFTPLSSGDYGISFTFEYVHA